MLGLVASTSRPVFVAKRDAKVWFDQLLAPACLRRWFARPPVSVKELLATGRVTSEDIRAALLEDGADVNALVSLDVADPMRPGRTAQRAALFLAIAHKQDSAVRWLLDHGANPGTVTVHYRDFDKPASCMHV